MAIEINASCNRKCAWCPNSKYRRPKDQFLDDRIFYKIIDELVELSFKGQITFNLYNEPLLDSRLAKFIHYSRKSLPDAYIYLNTNGDLLNIELWKLLRRNGLDYATISQYDRGVNRNITRLMEALSPEEKKNLEVRIFNESYISNRAGLIDTSTELPLKRSCRRPFYQLCITCEGKAVICCNDYFGKVEIGDVRRESIDQIWNSRVLKYYRKKLKKGDRGSLLLCKDCDMLE